MNVKTLGGVPCAELCKACFLYNTVRAGRFRNVDCTKEGRSWRSKSSSKGEGVVSTLRNSVSVAHFLRRYAVTCVVSNIYLSCNSASLHFSTITRENSRENSNGVYMIMCMG